MRAAAPGGAAFVAANRTTWADVTAAPAIDWKAYRPPQQVKSCTCMLHTMCKYVCKYVSWSSYRLHC